MLLFVGMLEFSTLFAGLCSRGLVTRDLASLPQVRRLLHHLTLLPYLYALHRHRRELSCILTQSGSGSWPGICFGFCAGSTFSSWESWGCRYPFRTPYIERVNPNTAWFNGFHSTTTDRINEIQVSKVHKVSGL